MTNVYKEVLKRAGLHPFMYVLVHEEESYIIVKNWFSGNIRYFHK